MFQMTEDYSNWISELKVGDEVFVSVTPLSDYSKRVYRKMFNTHTVKKITPKTKTIVLSDDSRFSMDGLIIKPKTGWAVDPHFNKDPNTRIFPMTEEDVSHMDKAKKVKDIVDLINATQSKLIDASEEDLDTLMKALQSI